MTSRASLPPPSSGSSGTPGDPTEDPRRNRLFAIIGLVVVAVAIVLLVIVFTRHPSSQQNCIAVTGAQPDQPTCQ